MGKQKIALEDVVTELKRLSDVDYLTETQFDALINNLRCRLWPNSTKQDPKIKNSVSNTKGK